MYAHALPFALPFCPDAGAEHRWLSEHVNDPMLC